MIRGILAVIVGFIVMVVWVIGTTLAGMATLTDLVLDESTREASLTWCLIQIGLGLVGGVIGGFLAAAIGAGPKKTPVKVLAGLVLVLGMGQAAMMTFGLMPQPEPSSEVLFNEPAGESSPEWLDKLKAISEAEQPTWFSFTIPVVGLVGVLLGGKLKRKGPAF